MAKLTLSFKGKVLKVIAVKDGPMTIGRDPSCDIHIDSLAVHLLHARLMTHDGHTTLQDSDSPDGTFVNHLRVDEHELADNDIIRVGKHVLRFMLSNDQVVIGNETSIDDAPISPSNEKNSRTGWLQILSGKHLGKTVKLKSSLTNLGKQGLQPALISLRNEGYFISNLSSNEIRVGDNPIGETSHLLNDGDMIHIGDTQMQFYLQ